MPGVSSSSGYNALLEDTTHKDSVVLNWSVTDKLYDRESQQEILLEAYQRAISSDKDGHEKQQQQQQRTELVLITGPSGMGKTTLATSLKRKLEGTKTNNTLFFVSGKFNQLLHNQPALQPRYSAFLAALEEFTKIAIDHGEEMRKSVKDDIETMIGSEIHVIAKAIPSLRYLLDDTGYPVKEEAIKSGWDHSKSKLVSQESFSTTSPSSSNSSSGITDTETRNTEAQFEVVLRRFILAVCSPLRPLVLLLDDLQWADNASLRLLERLTSPSILGNAEKNGLMLLATCRGNEVSINDPLSETLRRIEDSGTPIIDIKVRNLSLKALSLWISDVTAVDSTRCQPLAEIVHSQTGGNAFFAMHYLQSLQEDGFLFMDKGVWRWNVDELVMSIHNQSEDRMVRVLSERMKQLPDEVQEILKVASCLGADFHEGLLRGSGVVNDFKSVSPALQVAKQRGLILWDNSSQTGSFSHDKILEAAYFLIPDDEKIAFKLMIGRNLVDDMSSKELSEHLLLVVNLLGCGVSQMNKQIEKDNLAIMCLRAGRREARISAFSSAVEYVELGIRLLSPGCWREQYELSRDLYNAAVELQYCNGNHTRVDSLLQGILQHSRSFQDELPAIVTQMMSLAARGKVKEAVRICLDTLRSQGGEKFPSPKLTKVGCLIEFYKTKRILQARTDQDILSLREINDATIVGIMTIMHISYPIVMKLNGDLALLLAFRLIRLTIQHGLSPISSLGFTFYGCLLAKTGHVSEGCRYGHLAFRILEKFPGARSSLMPRVLMLTWATIFAEVEPLDNCLQPLLEAHRLARMRGDVEPSFIAAAIHSTIRLYTGHPLHEVEKSIRHYSDLSLHHGQVTVNAFVSIPCQVCRTLMGEVDGQIDDPLIVVMDGFQAKKESTASLFPRKSLFFGFILQFKIFIATYLNQYSNAEAMIREFQKYHIVTVSMVDAIQTFLQGIVAAGLARQFRKKRKKNLNVMRTSIKQLRKRALNCPENIMNKLFLIEAELARCNGKYDQAFFKYKESIKYAKRQRLINEEGLACEKAGRMLQESGNVSDALSYFLQARSLYNDWGAKAKVDELDGIIVEFRFAHT